MLTPSVAERLMQNVKKLRKNYKHFPCISLSLTPPPFSFHISVLFLQFFSSLSVSPDLWYPFVYLAGLLYWLYTSLGCFLSSGTKAVNPATNIKSVGTTAVSTAMYTESFSFFYFLPLSYISWILPFSSHTTSDFTSQRLMLELKFTIDFDRRSWFNVKTGDYLDPDIFKACSWKIWRDSRLLGQGDG